MAAARSALANVDLTVRDGAFVSLLGPSGCGKTTILRMVNGLITPDAGTITVSGRAPALGPEMGFVFQSFRLIPGRACAAMSNSRWSKPFPTGPNAAPAPTAILSWSASPALPMPIPANSLAA
ncbi:ATP-binding cassette domain-containing protein [Devosia sp. A8/3-2]|nr:ATP-binding cassette domain-containing protein [Devosia sp. A8/3-2]